MDKQLFGYVGALRPTFVHVNPDLAVRIGLPHQYLLSFQPTTPTYNADMILELPPLGDAGAYPNPWVVYLESLDGDVVRRARKTLKEVVFSN